MDRPQELTRRFLEQAVAVGLTRRSQVVFSHRTALAILGIPQLGPWPSEVEVLEPLGSSRRSKRGIRVHLAPFDDTDVMPWGEFWVTTPVRTLADVARALTAVFAVPSLDAGLTEFTPEAIHEVLERNGSAPSPRALRSLDFADSLSGSVGESASRVLMELFGAPRPQLQLRHPSPIAGKRYFKTDFEWPELKKIGEFDGREKFFKDELLGGKSPSQAVYEEKLREDALRREGNDVGRWGMPEVRRPPELRDRLTTLGIPLTRGNVRLAPLW
ncbi:MAG: hypothetical protein FWD85_02605 [Microbacteriaceae bacterium]|nr:hypothetical protein [Microbacteriaceae bacterium]MCL2794182.1 hypothetical protein [Microbacteriaceae bacterium]